MFVIPKPIILPFKAKTIKANMASLSSKATDQYLQKGMLNPCDNTIATSSDEQKQNLMFTLKTSDVCKTV